MSTAVVDPWDRVKAGSQAHKILTTVDRLSSELSRGVEIFEIRDAFSEHHGEAPPRALTSTVSSMRRRGVLEFAGGRACRSLYAPAGSSFECAVSELDLTPAVLDALQRLHRKYGRAISTRDIEGEVRRAHPDVPVKSRESVSAALRGLERETERGPVRGRPARVRRVEGAAPGIDGLFWLPLDAPESEAEAPPRPRSRADAARRAIAAASSDLGMPISTREMRWWSDGSPKYEQLREHLGRNQIGTALTDAARPDQYHQIDGRIRCFQTRYTAHGGAPLRFALNPTDPDAGLWCELMDLPLALRPADELESLRAVQIRAERQRSEVLADIHHARTAVLLARVSEAVGDEVRGRLQEGVRARFEVKGRWLDQSDRRWQYRREQLARERVQADGLIGLLPRAKQTNHDFDGPGDAALVLPRTLESLLHAASRQLGYARVKRRLLLATSRRFPLPGGRPLAERAHTFNFRIAGLDRVDVLTEIWTRFPVPIATNLVHSAQTVLGHNLRDIAFIRRCLDRVGASDRWTHQSLVVASGLLGELPRIEAAVPDGRSHQDAAAWVLAALFADWTSTPDVIQEDGRRLRGPAARVIETAARRLRSGHIFSVVG